PRVPDHRPPAPSTASRSRSRIAPTLPPRAGAGAPPRLVDVRRVLPPDRRSGPNHRHERGVHHRPVRGPRPDPGGAPVPPANPVGPVARGGPVRRPPCPALR